MEKYNGKCLKLYVKAIKIYNFVKPGTLVVLATPLVLM
jgi:hypothetical protein